MPYSRTGMLVGQGKSTAVDCGDQPAPRDRLQNVPKSIGEVAESAHSLFIHYSISSHRCRGSRPNSLPNMRPLLSALARGPLSRGSIPLWKTPIRPVRTADAPAELQSIYGRQHLQSRPFTHSFVLRDSLYNVDHPAKLVRVNQKHGPGLIIIGMLSHSRRRATFLIKRAPWYGFYGF